MNLFNAPEPAALTSEEAGRRLEADVLRSEILKRPLGDPVAEAMQRRINDGYAAGAGGESVDVTLDAPVADPLAPADAEDSSIAWPSAPSAEQWDASFQSAAPLMVGIYHLQPAETQAILTAATRWVAEGTGRDPDELAAEGWDDLVARWGEVGAARKKAQAEAELAWMTPKIAQPIVRDPRLHNHFQMVELLSDLHERRMLRGQPRRPSIL